jgi:lactosylceramide 4-alpha-galactosyltransferase
MVVDFKKFFFFICCINALIVVVFFYGKAFLPNSLSINFLFKTNNQSESRLSGFEKHYLINFLETDLKGDFFSPRQMCSIESTAINNPQALVQVFSVRAKFNTSIDLTKLYPNIRLIDLDLNRLFNGTPLAQWWTDGKVNESPFAVSHTSDAARLAVLWNYGGIYSDLDFLCLKSYESLVSYGIGLNYYNVDNGHMFNGAFMLFKAKSPYLWYMMQRYAKNYQAKLWDFNGPRLVINSIKEMCDLDDPFENLSSTMNQTTRLVSAGQKCDDIFVFPESYLSPIDWNEFRLKDFFTVNVTEENLWQNELIQQAFTIHLYNKVSKDFKLDVNLSSAYIQIAKQMCPSNFKYVLNHNIEF